jgi:hypothetical protein
MILPAPAGAGGGAPGGRAPAAVAEPMLPARRFRATRHLPRRDSHHETPHENSRSAAGHAWPAPALPAGRAGQPPPRRRWRRRSSLGGQNQATNSTADHSKFDVLQEDLQASGPEVTKACLACHTEAAKQVHKTKHWTWEFMNPETQQRWARSTSSTTSAPPMPSNYEFCTACHVGYGWKDKNFDFAAQENVDCLVCHDTTGTYRKLPGLAGHPPYKDMEYPPHSGKIVKAPDLGQVARKVSARPAAANCGACHFYGGGGDAVKHGDLDSSHAQSRQVPRRAHGQGRPRTSPAAPATSHLRPRRARQPLRADGNGKKAGAHMRGKKDVNPSTCQACHGTRPHPANGQAQRPHRQDRLPDLPHPGIRPRRHRRPR